MASERETWRPRHGDLGLVQGDLSTNLFMIFVIVLSVLAVLAVVTTGFLVPFKGERDLETPPAVVRSWSPVQPLYPKLVVRNGQVARLTFDPWARAFASGDRFAPEIPGFDQSRRLSDDSDPAAYLLDFLPLGDPLPSALIAWSMREEAFAEDLPPLLAADFARYEAFDLIVYPGQEEAAWDVLLALDRANKRRRLLFMPDPARFRLIHRSADYSFEKVYK